MQSLVCNECDEMGEAGGRLLFGESVKTGVTVKWHDFTSAREIDRSASYQAETMEICVNFAGRGTVNSRKRQRWTLLPRTVSHYATDRRRGSSLRSPRERHLFLSVEFSRDWLSAAVGENVSGATRPIQRFLAGEACGEVRQIALPPEMRLLAEEIVNPPVIRSGEALWYQGKILELLAHTAFTPEQELGCDRQKWLARERVETVKSALARDLECPPSLAELGRECGCSPCYLSRIFSEETGMTISRYLRNLRLETAADLLRTGKHNVTEVAMMVGYSSLSYFGKAFASHFGTCPCLFPLREKTEGRPN